jgi:hypothetical protein
MRKILHNAVCMGSSIQRKTFLYLIQAGPFNIQTGEDMSPPPQPSYWSPQSAILPPPSEVPTNYLQ